jgi:hypothetical protein
LQEEGEEEGEEVQAGPSTKSKQKQNELINYNIYFKNKTTIYKNYTVNYFLILLFASINEFANFVMVSTVVFKVWIASCNLLVSEVC